MVKIRLIRVAIIYITMRNSELESIGTSVIF